LKFQLKRILFPVDFSERCRVAAPYVEALSTRFDAELILLHVLEPLTYNSPLSHRGIEPEDFDRLFDANLSRLRVERVVEHWAKHLAEEYQAELTLMHVSSDGESRKALDSLQNMVGSHAHVRVEPGDPAKVVVRTAIELGADLLVIGRKPLADSEGRLDTTAYAIIRRSDCPVISV
jgi:nucleotide-binding universal stress UspA family protein